MFGRARRSQNAGQFPRPVMRWRRPYSLFAALAVLATAVLATSAQSATANSAQRQAASLPPIPSYDDYGAYLDGTAGVSKARVTIAIPTTLFRVYANRDFVNGPVYFDSYSDAWVASPNGSPSKYGYFPPIQTAILAFGSIPVTATVQLVQPFDKAGDPVSFLIFGHGLANFPYTVYPTKVSGDVQLHLSNVTVDQVPLDVGAHCQLKTPMHMLLYGDSPAYNLFTGGPLAGTATIPAFTGCQSGGQDLDPLITGMISGPNTQLSLRQGALGAWIQPNGPCGDPCGPPHS